LKMCYVHQHFILPNALHDLNKIQPLKSVALVLLYTETNDAGKRRWRMLAEKQVMTRFSEVAARNRWRPREKKQIKRILIVDDSPSLALIVRQMLEVADYQTRVAHDAQLGYLAYLEFGPDLVVTDVYMNGETGPEMMTRIRRHEARIRTIYMSGYPFGSGELPDADRTGHPDSFFLQKPFSRDELLHLIGRFSS
jgi:CheY-like chemotaxis protein